MVIPHLKRIYDTHAVQLPPLLTTVQSHSKVPRTAPPMQSH